MKCLITGASRGIGLEMCRQLAARGDEVIATCRAPSNALDACAGETGRVRVLSGIDVASDEGLERLTRELVDEQLDLLINNAGIMSSVTLADLDIEAIRAQFEVNALAPLRVTHRLLGRLNDGAKIGIITSRMGSIDDNDSGGSYGYRMSKVAANMAGRSLSVDLRERGIAVALLHPGWVRTDMTGGSGLIDTDESAKGLIRIMDRLDLPHTGLFWHTNGEILPW